MINNKNISIKKIILLTMLTAITLNIHSQKLKTFYITGDGERSSKNYAKFKRTVYNKDNKWIVHDYYLNDSLQMSCYFLDKNLTKKTDTFTYYYLNGKISQIVVYENGLKQGYAKSYYLTGNLSKSANYNKGEIYGKWIWYNEDGSIETELENVDKKLIRKFYYPAVYVGGKKNLNEYLKKVEYPFEAQMNATYGQTITTFQINEEGKVNDVDIIVHGTEEMDSSIIRHLYNMPTWGPAKKNGKIVSARYVLPIQFTYQSKKVSLSDEIISKAFFKSGVDDYKQENYEKAVFKFEQAIKRNNMEAKYYYFMGHCYYKKKNQDMACENWTIANLLDREILKKEIKDLCNLN